MESLKFNYMKRIDQELALILLIMVRGIPKHEQEFIFEPFYRGENKKLKVRGLGLGLPYSKMLAKAQNGDLMLKESNEVGTTFTLYIKKH